MMKIILIMFLNYSIQVTAQTDCSTIDDFKSSLYGMLKSDLLPIDANSPEEDAKLRIENGDLRLLAYGLLSGMKIPKEQLLKKNQICLYGVKVIQGMTDSFESSEHRKLVHKLREYINKYNTFMVKHIKKMKV